MENLSIEITAQGGHEIRTGELPPVHVSSGFLEESVSIPSLTKFIQARIANGQANYQDSCLTISSKLGKAEFVSDMNRKTRETYLLRGKFIVEENEVSIAILQAKTFDLTAFRKWVSRMKPYFADANDHRELSDRLLTYSASAQIEISDKKDNQANFAKNYTQQASSKLPQFVLINFEGGQVFKTEICFSLRDNNTTFWLECFEYEHWLIEQQRAQFKELKEVCEGLHISVLEKLGFKIS